MAGPLLSAAVTGWKHAFGLCPERRGIDRFYAWCFGTFARQAGRPEPATVEILDRHAGQVVGTIDGAHVQVARSSAGVVGCFLADVAVENWKASREWRAAVRET